MEASLESLLQVAAVDQLIGYEHNQTANNLLQVDNQKVYPAYLDDLSNTQQVPNVDETAGFGDGLDLNDGSFGKYYKLLYNKEKCS